MQYFITVVSLALNKVWRTILVVCDFLLTLTLLCKRIHKVLWPLRSAWILIINGECNCEHVISESLGPWRGLGAPVLLDMLIHNVVPIYGVGLVE